MTITENKSKNGDRGRRFVILYRCRRFRKNRAATTGAAYITAAMALTTASILRLFSAATQMRPVLTA
jgi:hypothetical protein